MYYNSSSIDALVGRIGWEQPVPPTAITLDAALTTPASGRYVSAFHPLATVDNIYLTMPASLSEPVGDNADSIARLNAYLSNLRRQSVLKVLARVFDNNERAALALNAYGNNRDISDRDYSDGIIAQPARYDEAIGYQMAYDALFMMLTSTRSNIRERAIGDKGMLKMEMEGAVDENGKRVAPGLSQRLSAAIGNITNVLFPKAPQKTYLNVVHPW